MNSINRSLYLIGNYYKFVEYLLFDRLISGSKSLTIHLDIPNYSFRLIYGGNHPIDNNLIEMIRYLSSVHFSDSNDIHISDIFYTFPLRRKLINVSYEFNKVVEIIHHMSIYNHSLGITLHYNNSTLTLTPSIDTLSAFNQVHSTNIQQAHEISHHSHQLSVDGFIAFDCHSTPAYQHLYINHHHLDKQHSIYLSVNRLLRCNTPKHPIYVIKIHLPHSKLDSFNNTLHIDNDKDILSILNQLIQDFLIKHDYKDENKRVYHSHSLSNAMKKKASSAQTRKTIKGYSDSSNKQSEWLEGILGVSMVLRSEHS